MNNVGSKNWAGRPLDSYETILNCIRSTKTKTGLEVDACLVHRQYIKGVKIDDSKMSQIHISTHDRLAQMELHTHLGTGLNSGTYFCAIPKGWR